MAKHTKGPWFAEVAWIIGRDGRVVADTNPDSDAPGGGTDEGFFASEEAQANARLIAAAPDLLAAGQMLERGGMLACSCPDDRWFTCGGCQMRAAIRRATDPNGAE